MGSEAHNELEETLGEPSMEGNSTPKHLVVPFDEELYEQGLSDEIVLTAML